MNVCQVMFGVSSRRTKDASSSQLKARPEKKNSPPYISLAILTFCAARCFRSSRICTRTPGAAQPRVSIYLSFIILIMEAGEMTPAQ